MTAELYAAIIATAISLTGAASGYLLGRSHGRADGYKRGLHIGAVSWKATASRLAEEWANRREWPFEPGRLASNQTERGRRERNFACLDMLCKRFQIPMPERRTNRED